MLSEKKNKRIPLNIQMFAEGDPNPPADPNNDGAGNQNKDKLFTQAELNRATGNAREEGRLAVLKELGIDVEEVSNAKEAIQKVKEQEKNNQTEIDRLKSENDKLLKTNSELLSFKKDTVIQNEIANVLKDEEIEVDASYSSTIFKILKGEGAITEIYKDEEIDTDTLKEKVQNILKTDLKILEVNETNKKKQFAGRSMEKNPKYTSAVKEHNDRKYGNNPFYPGYKRK
jgi:hypothetical protein